MKKIIVGLISFGFLINAYCASSDSVMNTPSNLMTPSISSFIGTKTGVSLVPISTVENKTDICPSGFSGPSGGATYISQTRQITTYYSGSTAVGVNYGVWTDTDQDCRTTQTQVIACDVAYTGTKTQQRTAISASSGGLQYSDWITTIDACVLKPVDTGILLSSSTAYYTGVVVYLYSTSTPHVYRVYNTATGGNTKVIEDASFTSYVDESFPTQKYLVLDFGGGLHSFFAQEWYQGQWWNDSFIGGIFNY